MRPFLEDGLHDGDFTFLTYPSIKTFTEMDQKTGQMSAVQVEWFSVVDGPTGVIYARSYFPCWIVSIAAVVALLTSVTGLFVLRSE
ncbi:MAG: hypothetical protein U1F65_12455 [Verrucomicrobiota bacterium]